MATTLTIARIDTSTEDAGEAIRELRRRLSPRGNVVSPQGLARTIAAFGEPLTPQQVVERICEDVRVRGLEAVLDYTSRIDGVALDPGSVRVGQGRPRLFADDSPCAQ
jgi:histidinol dehydrogenase